MKTQVSKLFGSRSGYRSMLWLEGKRLAEAGFTPGQEYHQAWLNDRIMCVIPGVLDIDAGPTFTRKVNKHDGNPAIRIEGKRLQQLFGEKFADVEVTYDKGVITIMGKNPVVVELQQAA